MLKKLFAILKREIYQSLARGGGAFMPTSFFLGAILILPFSLGQDLDILAKIGGPYIWVAMSLACLVSLERLFQPDIDDGTMEILLLGDIPFSLANLAKVIGCWIAVSLPLLIAIPFAVLMLKLPSFMIIPIMLQLATGSFAMFMIGSIGAALSAGVRRGGLLIALLNLPLYSPIVIFGANATNMVLIGNPFINQGYLLICAISLVAIVIAPIAISVSLKLHMD